MNTKDMNAGSTVNRPKRKRRRNVHVEERHSMMCAVCGEKAHGYNFDVITCDSCKVFFRRILTREEMTSDIKEWLNSCTQGHGACVIDKITRKRCSPCRMKKCLEAGMKREWITPLSDLVRRSNFHGSVRRKSGNASSSDTSKNECRPTLNTEEHSASLTGLQRCKTELEVAPSILPMKVEAQAPLDIRTDFSYDAFPMSSHSPSASDGYYSFSQCGIDQVTSDLFTTLFDSYVEILGNVYFTLVQPLAKTDVDKFQLYDKQPSTEYFFNSQEFVARRLIQAFKEVPQFTMLTKEAQIVLVKNSMRPLISLYFLLYVNFDTEKATFEYFTDKGNFTSTDFMFDNRVRHNIYSIPAEQYPALLAIFEPHQEQSNPDFVPLVDIEVIREFMDEYSVSPYTRTIDELLTDKVSDKTPNTSSNSIPSYPMGYNVNGYSSLSLVTPLENMFNSQRASIDQQVDNLFNHIRNSCRQFVEAASNDQRLLIVACLMRLYGVDEDLSHLKLQKNDEFLVKKTQNELQWFLLQYARRLWDPTLRPQCDWNTTDAVSGSTTDLFNCGLVNWCPDEIRSALLTPASASLSYSHLPLTERLAELKRINTHLGKIDKFTFYMYYYVCREQISPLMKEFLPCESVNS